MAKNAALLGAMMGGARFLGSQTFNDAQAWIDDAINRVLAGFPGAASEASKAFNVLHWFVHDALTGALGFAAFLVPLAFIVRLLARSSVRAGERDPLDRFRGWTTRRRREAFAALSVFVSALWVAHGFAWFHRSSHPHLATFLVPAGVGALIQIFAARRWGRELVAPTIEDGAPSTMTIAADEIVFHAVAVTRETKLAIAAVGLPALPLVVWFASLPIGELYRNVHVFQVFAAYVAYAAIGATFFARASRVAVGIDGVRVYGTSRTRFFAYRDLDGARITGGDVELLRKDRVVLRLQLHGEDAVRRDAVLARVVENIAKSQDRRAVAAHRLVEGKSTKDVARVASGGGDYRAPSITRDQLWQLVEGQTTDASSRTAAAQALVATIDPSERGRLRVAASQCAETRVRVALERIAEGIAIEPDEGARPAVARRAAT